MTKRTRRDAVFYVEQTDGIMKARDKVKRYIRMSEMFQNKSTYLKICGVRYNGERNAKLNDKDLEVLNAGIDTVIKGLKEFKQELNKTVDREIYWHKGDGVWQKFNPLELKDDPIEIKFDSKKP